ncbi:MAG: autoinducer 2 sensor kinase/phosphatase LuxQ [Candidatus Parcubacteria bacterium]
MANKHKEYNLSQIFQLLHEQIGIDFAEYKHTTMSRRIGRRMALHKITSVHRYLTYLRSNPSEASALRNDLLIHVTRFFRDPDKFKALQTLVFPRLVKHNHHSQPIRIWIAGSATGEEAYSMAISFVEFLEKKSIEVPIQIFATDISSEAIEYARQGIYSSSIGDQVSPDRLKRFFEKNDTKYRVIKKIRDMCVFAVHDLAQDPPFSNLDMVSCLNVFIYLNQTLQKKILPLFHYALHNHGFLVLGDSESVGTHKHLFHMVDSKHKIYSKIPSKHNVLNHVVTYQKKMEEKLSSSKRPAIHNTGNNLQSTTDYIPQEKKIEMLREALNLTRTYADSIIKELSNMTEELQSTNEELVVNNEELQTTNEELETSQEELQSANEELLTLNETLRKQEETQSRLAAIVESSDDAIISKDLNGLITSWNKGAQRLYGYTPEEIIGKPVETLIPPERRNDFATIINRLKQGHRVAHYETKRITKDKRIIDVSLTVSPIRNSAGVIIGASKIARDITEKKKADENTEFLSEASKLFSSSLDYQSTLKAVGKMAVKKLADWCMVYLPKKNDNTEIIISARDPKMQRIVEDYTKRFPSQPGGKTMIAHVLQTKQPLLIKEVTEHDIKRMARNENHKKALQRLRSQSAITVPLSIYKTTIGALTLHSIDSHRHFNTSDLHLAQELANRASLAIENARLYSDAQKAIVLRDDFISIASHELKTPVTSLKLYTQVLQKHNGKTNKETVSEYLSKMNHQIDNLNMLVRDLLDISRLKHGKLEFQQEEFDLNKLVKQTIENIQTTTKKHKIILEGAVERKITGDVFRIDQVLVNLLTNAIKYSPKADKIIVRISQKKDTAVVQVQDFGIGIDEKYHKNIFKRFYRVEGPKEKTYPGLGIGLYISYEIIKRHGGTIQFTSNKQIGSTFSFTLPLHEDVL